MIHEFSYRFIFLHLLSGLDLLFIVYPSWPVFTHSKRQYRGLGGRVGHVPSLSEHCIDLYLCFWRSQSKASQTKATFCNTARFLANLRTARSFAANSSVIPHLWTNSKWRQENQRISWFFFSLTLDSDKSLGLALLTTTVQQKSDGSIPMPRADFAVDSTTTLEMGCSARFCWPNLSKTRMSFEGMEVENVGGVNQNVSAKWCKSRRFLSLLQNVLAVIFASDTWHGCVCQECLYGDCNWEMQMAKSAGNGRPVPQYILRHLCECVKGLVIKFGDLSCSWPACECVTWDVSKMVVQDMTRNQLCCRHKSTGYCVCYPFQASGWDHRLSGWHWASIYVHRWEMMGRYSLKGHLGSPIHAYIWRCCVFIICLSLHMPRDVLEAGLHVQHACSTWPSVSCVQNIACLCLCFAGTEAGAMSCRVADAGYTCDLQIHAHGQWCLAG